MEDEGREAIEKMFGKAGEPVPAVEIADLKKMWEHNRELQARHPGEQFGVAVGVWQHILPSGADVMAISHRCAQLGMVETFLRPMWTGGEPSEAAFKAAATMEMKRMAVGVVFEGRKMLEQFFEEVRKAAA